MFLRWIIENSFLLLCSLAQFSIQSKLQHLYFPFSEKKHQAIILRAEQKRKKKTFVCFNFYCLKKKRLCSKKTMWKNTFTRSGAQFWVTRMDFRKEKSFSLIFQFLFFSFCFVLLRQRWHQSLGNDCCKLFVFNFECWCWRSFEHHSWNKTNGFSKCWLHEPITKSLEK